MSLESSPHLHYHHASLSHHCFLLGIPAGLYTSTLAPSSIVPPPPTQLPALPRHIVTWSEVGEGVRKLLPPDKTRGCCILLDKALIHFLLLGPSAASLSHIGTTASSLIVHLGPSLNVATAMQPVLGEGWQMDLG